MKASIYQIAKNEKLKKRATKIYRQGFSLREVGKIIGRSYEWVRMAIIEKK